MQCTVKKLNATKYALAIDVPRSDLKDKETEAFKSLNSILEVPGFRKGKASFDIFLRYHKSAFEDELVKKSVPFYCEEAFKQHNLEIIDYPTVKDIHLDKDGLRFTAEAEIKPEVVVQESLYKDVPVKRQDDEVKDKEIDKAVENIHHIVGELTSEKLSPEEFAKFSGYADEAELREAIRTEIRLEKLKRNKMVIEDAIVEHLLGKVSFSVPETQLKRQVEHIMNQELQNLRMRGVSEEQMQQQKEELRKKAMPLAEKQLKLYYILEKIIEAEKIKRDKVKDVFSVGLGIILRYARWGKA